MTHSQKQILNRTASLNIPFQELTRKRTGERKRTRGERANKTCCSNCRLACKCYKNISSAQKTKILHCVTRRKISWEEGVGGSSRLTARDVFQVFIINVSFGSKGAFSFRKIEQDILSNFPIRRTRVSIRCNLKFAFP